MNRVSPDIYPPFKGVTTRHFHSWTKREGIEVSSPDAASSSRMSLVELCYKLRGIDIVPRPPGVMLNSKSFPFYQVAELFITLLSRIFSTIHSSSPSINSGGGGGCGRRPSIGSSGAGVSLTTLKTGCSLLIDGGSRRR